MPAAHVCVTCGTQFADGEGHTASCPICEDDRQYVGWSGQQWTTLGDLRAGHHNVVRDDLGVTGIGTEPSLAIGQRALFVRLPQGNVLWDCFPVLDDAT